MAEHGQTENAIAKEKQIGIDAMDISMEEMKIVTEEKRTAEGKRDATEYTNLANMYHSFYTQVCIKSAMAD